MNNHPRLPFDNIECSPAKTDVSGKVSPVRRRREEVFNDYEGFVEKFKPKKTTDDCYTPPAVYDAVLGWVKENASIGDRPVVRPFYPGEDYKRFDYPDGCVVIDNPPFSIISRIARFYQAKEISFFLFAPHLTLFSATNVNWTQIVSSSVIVYENGAQVRTSFISNMFGDIRILVAPDLHDRLEKVGRPPAKSFPKYVYPDNLITASRLSHLAMHGQPMSIHGDQVHQVAILDSQRRAKSAGIFGGGYLCSDAVAREVAVREVAAREAAVREAAVREAAAREAANVIVWELSEKEREIAKGLK